MKKSGFLHEMGLSIQGSLFVSLFCAAPALVACSDSGVGGGGVGDGGQLDGGPGTGGAGGTTDPFANRCNFNPSDLRICTFDQYKSKATRLDIYVMFDQSGSMAIKDNGTNMRIDQVRMAVRQFLSDPQSTGVGVGIGYFGQQPLECGCTSCEPSTYATPAVNMGILPGHGTGVMASLDAIAPTGETPTGAAIRGACSYAKSWKDTHANHKVVILLVTDGEPKAPLTSQKGGCNPTLQDAVAASSACAAAGTEIQTYVLGVGPSLENLNQIALAGGTQKAYLVASGGSAEILAALNNIRSDAIPCALKMPTPPKGMTLDVSTTKVIQADATCSQYTNISKVPAEAGCDPQAGGWYYDNPSAPTQIRLCPSSCEQSAAPGQELSIQMDCAGLIVN